MSGLGMHPFDRLQSGQMGWAKQTDLEADVFYLRAGRPDIKLKPPNPQGMIMNFKMYSESFDFAEVNEAVIRQAVAELAAGKLEFLVLEAGQTVDGNAYIQTAMDDGDFILETRFIYHESKGKPKLFGLRSNVEHDDYKHYQKIGLTANEVEKAFLNYIKGINPDVTEDGWELMEI